MQTQLKVIKGDQKKGKSFNKCQTTTDKLQYFMDFNQSISLTVAKTMPHLSKFVLISMVNFTLTRRDSYLDHPRSCIKQDRLNALRTAPLNIASLLTENVLEGRGRPSTL